MKVYYKQLSSNAKTTFLLGKFHTHVGTASPPPLVIFHLIFARMNCSQLLFHLIYLIWEKQFVRMALHRNLLQGNIGGDLRISFNSVQTAQ